MGGGAVGRCTEIQNLLKSGRKYWAIRSSARSFARTAHSFACSALLASLARSAALIRSLARSLAHSGAHGKEVFVYELNASISCSFNPLWAARLCVYVCVSLCVCECAYVCVRPTFWAAAPKGGRSPVEQGESVHLSIRPSVPPRERTNERRRARERTNERSGAREQSEQCRARK